MNGVKVALLDKAALRRMAVKGERWSLGNEAMPPDRESRAWKHGLSQTHAVGFKEDSSAAAKLQILIISHQVSPVNAGLHPDAKYTHTFSLPEQPPRPPLLSPPAFCRNAKACNQRDAQMGRLHRGHGHLSVPSSRRGVSEASGCGSAYLCFVVCGNLCTRG